MSVSNVMSRRLITMELDDDLAKAKSIFDSTNIHHILVTHNKELVGIITDRDVYKHLSPTIGTNKESAKDTMLLYKKVHLIMERNLITAKASTSLNEAALLFHDNHISCLPIVNNDFHPIGIITWRDIIKILALQYKEKLKSENN